MPTYDYECDACGHEFELFQQISEAIKKKCPECGKRKLRRLFGTGAAIMFKGSGFYETDYRSESYKKGAEAEKKSQESSSDSSTADSKKPAESKSADTKSAGQSSSGDSKPKSKKKD